MSARYAAIVLAGGLSTRMEKLKPLLPIGEETIADRVIASFINSGVDVILVVGYRRDEIKAGIKKRDITIVDNRDFKKGMFTSIQAGVRCLQPAHQAFFIMPVDTPLVRPATFKLLMDKASQNPGKIVYPVFAGKRGHPSLIPASLAPGILNLKKTDMLKSLLLTQENQALEIIVADSNILFDVDTPEDYAALLERFRRYDIPTDEECEIILNDICKVAPARIRHCYKVSEVTVALAQALNAAGKNIDLALVRAAAILHDIAKGQPKHDIVGGYILKELGFGRTGDIIAVHSELSGGNVNLPLESKIVFLADKFVEGEKPVSIEERYAGVNRRHGLTPEIQAKVWERRDVALLVKKELEEILSRPLEEIIPRL
jgi:molybdenum cofactor cytidylyltransferase